MAIKKSELYSALWASCDELRGGMDASLYKDYVLVLLFIKYISDKYADQPFAAIKVPKGASFKDMVALKGKPTIGDDINKKILQPIAEANNLIGTVDVADFDSSEKLGQGKEKVDKLTKLIAIFESPHLDFSKNKAEGDDIIGDAYEYLMRHFATESGKSKGQFYTPAEVSRILAKILGINNTNTSRETTVYDPTCGSGSLLLRLGAETTENVSIYGQEMDVATSALARMNMVLHNHASDIQTIKQGNTMANPAFLEHGHIRRFDYVVANPPFSNKNWSNGIDPYTDERFTNFGVPPEKNGDYAFLLHIVASLKSTGKGAVILPHGVLFRGNAEGEIRKNLLERGYIKGIIGLPPNLFYGTGIPACIIFLDKTQSADSRVFMIDAAKGFVKDGNKNRLREQDIHKIVDIFTQKTEVLKFSRWVTMTEISDPKNDYNLNIPRYIDSQTPEDLHDIMAHLQGDIPRHDVDALNEFWAVFPNLKNSLFLPTANPAYAAMQHKPADLKPFILQHAEFLAFNKTMNDLYDTWEQNTCTYLKALTVGCKPKAVIHAIAESILDTYTDRPLLDKYDAYQHLLDYWHETMQDDTYIIAAEGWQANVQRITITNPKTQKTTDKGWDCDLIPKQLVINRYFAAEKQALTDLETEKERIAADINDMEEEHCVEDGLFAKDFSKTIALKQLAKLESKVNKKQEKKQKTTQKTKALPAQITSMVAEAQAPYNTISEGSAEQIAEINLLKQYIALCDALTDTNKKIKTATAELDDKLLAHYPTLTDAQIKQLVVEDKWLTTIAAALQNEMERVSQTLTQRITLLADRYATPLPALLAAAEAAEAKVQAHLALFCRSPEQQP
jgi:type I restriction enzyme M protein